MLGLPEITGPVAVVGDGVSHARGVAAWLHRCETGYVTQIIKCAAWYGGRTGPWHLRCRDRRGKAARGGSGVPHLRDPHAMSSASAAQPVKECWLRGFDGDGRRFHDSPPSCNACTTALTRPKRKAPGADRAALHLYLRPLPLYDIPSGRCSFTGPWTVTRSSLRMLRRVAAFCRPLRPVVLLVSFPRSRSPVIGVLGLC